MEDSIRGIPDYWQESDTDGRIILNVSLRNRL
jgi:hypothetical protein